MKIVSKMATVTNSSLSALAVLSALLLAGCSMDGAEIEDSYVAQSAEERYPIKVADAAAKMNIDARGGALRADGMNRVIAFAQDARTNSTSRVTVRYASGSSGARNVAQQAVGVLVDQGVPRGMISTGSYRGSGAMVTLSFTRKVAVTKECGDWSQNMTGDQYNEPYPNQGCALQQNIAAMVANPEDFEAPRTMTPVYGAPRSAPLRQYNTGEMVTGADGGQVSGGDTGSSGSGGDAPSTSE